MGLMLGTARCMAASLCSPPGCRSRHECQFGETESQRCVRNVRHIAAFLLLPDFVCVKDRLSAWGGGILPWH